MSLEIIFDKVDVYNLLIIVVSKLSLNFKY